MTSAYTTNFQTKLCIHYDLEAHKTRNTMITKDWTYDAIYVTLKPFQSFFTRNTKCKLFAKEI